MKLPAAVVALVVLGVVGCAPIPTVQIDRSLQVINAEDSGTIIGTIGARLGRFSAEVSPYTLNTLYFRKVGEKTGGTLEFSPPNPPIRTYTPDFENERFKGNVFSLTLPPGNYELYSVRFYYNNGSFENTFTPRSEFSIPFSVEKGKTTYLGSLMAWGVWGKNFLKIPVPAGGYFVVEDQLVRDLPLIQARHPVTTAPQVKLLAPDTRIPFLRRQPVATS